MSIFSKEKPQLCRHGNDTSDYCAPCLTDAFLRDTLLESKLDRIIELLEPIVEIRQEGDGE